MTWLKTIVTETLGLFVDDAAFACAILSLLALAYLGSALFATGQEWDGFVLFAGLGAIVLESTTRFARKPKK